MELIPDSKPSNEILKLSSYLKVLKYGKVTITVKSGKPVMITHATKDVKLTED